MAKNDKQWSSATPGLLIILVDKSGSMMLKYKNEPVSRTEFATRVINRVINDIIKKNFNGKEPKNRCFISVISYCAEVKEECSGFLTDLYKSPKRIETVTKKVSDGAGSLVDKIVKMPIWVEPTDTDTWTDMRGAFVMAKKLVESWMADKPDNPAPVIINISDGVPYYDHKSNSVCVEETKAVANEIMNISNSDGNVLIFNAEIGDTSKEIINPFDDNDVKNGGQGAEFLYEISSVIPEGYIDAAHKNELPVKPNSRGCVFSADAVSLIKLIDFGSSKGLGDK